MRYLLAATLLLYLVAPALGQQTPEGVVRKVYDARGQDKSHKEILRQQENCFTPGFLGIIEKALAKKPGSASFVDFDFFYNTQDGGMEYEVVETSIEGTRAIVSMQNFQRGDYRNPEPDPDWRQKVLRRPMAVYLADVGQGWQIMNIVFLPHQQTGNDGSIHSVEKLDVRQVLEEIGK